MSSLARVRKSGILFQSNFCNLFFAVRVIEMSVTTGSPQGESLLYLDWYPLWMFYTAKTKSFFSASFSVGKTFIDVCVE